MLNDLYLQQDLLDRVIALNGTTGAIFPSHLTALHAARRTLARRVQVLDPSNLHAPALPVPEARETTPEDAEYALFMALMPFKV